MVVHLFYRYSITKSQSSICCLTFPGSSAYFGSDAGWKSARPKVINPPKKKSHEESKMDHPFGCIGFDRGNGGRVDVAPGKSKTRATRHQGRGDSRQRDDENQFA